MDEKLSFNNSKGLKIQGILSDPGSVRAVLLCHGLGSSKDSSIYKKLADNINKLGLATFRIDFLGHGDSEGHYEDLTLTEATDDIIRARELLLKKGFSDIGFVGSSFGAVGGIMAAEKERFSFMVLISPPSHYDVSEIFMSGMHILKEFRKFHKKKDGLNDKRRAGLKIAFFRDYGAQDSYVAATKIKCPVLIIHGDKDNIVPLAKSRELRKKIKNSKIKIFKGVDHHYSHPSAQKKLIEEVVKFIEEKKIN